MQGHDRVLSVEKTTENKFLNMYDLQYENKVGGHGVYHIASRAMSMEELKMKTRENKPDGVIIYSLYGEKKDHVVRSPVPFFYRRFCIRISGRPGR